MSNYGRVQIRTGRAEHDELWALSKAGLVIIVDKALFASDK